MPGFIKKYERKLRKQRNTELMTIYIYIIQGISPLLIFFDTLMQSDVHSQPQLLPAFWFYGLHQDILVNGLRGPAMLASLADQILHHHSFRI